ncbi:hypothetical protein [Pandoraea sp. CB10b_02]|uniref:hypothetical protein n=1 Tax=Pandoraea sp. CB10b_02 TaxID=2014535 RepID=UPI00257C8D0E|nr:hypothetical protein [Pandoraea sp. CB10b_02]
MLDLTDCGNNAALSHQWAGFGPRGADFGRFRGEFSELPDPASDGAPDRAQCRMDRAFGGSHDRLVRHLSEGAPRCYNLGLSRGRVVNKAKGFPLAFKGPGRIFGVFCPRVVPNKGVASGEAGDIRLGLETFEIAGRRTQGARFSQAGHAKLCGSLAKRVRQPV